MLGAPGGARQVLGEGDGAMGHAEQKVEGSAWMVLVRPPACGMPPHLRGYQALPGLRSSASQTHAPDPATEVASTTSLTDMHGAGE